MGMDIPDIMDAAKFKTWCPWGGIYHSDGGMKKSFMIYPETNTAHCFAGCGHFTPVKLWADSLDVSLEDAAILLLEKVGYVSEDLDARWAAALDKQEFVQTATLAEALKVYCRRIAPTWETLQTQPEISSKLAQCLDLLDRVQTKDDATRWLAVAKRVMAITLGVEQ
jgi:hypothetical protein